MKTINGEDFLSPLEASKLLEISHKTLQRWADAQGRWTWARNGGPTRKRERREVTLDIKYNRAGHRLYRRADVQRLLEELLKEEVSRAA